MNEAQGAIFSFCMPLIVAGIWAAVYQLVQIHKILAKRPQILSEDL